MLCVLPLSASQTLPLGRTRLGILDGVEDQDYMMLAYLIGENMPCA